MLAHMERGFTCCSPGVSTECNIPPLWTRRPHVACSHSWRRTVVDATERHRNTERSAGSNLHRMRSSSLSQSNTAASCAIKHNKSALALFYMLKYRVVQELSSQHKQGDNSHLQCFLHQLFRYCIWLYSLMAQDLHKPLKHTPCLQFRCINFDCYWERTH